MMLLMKRKLASYPCKNSKSLFSIHLIEHEDGCVSALSEWVGDGTNALEVGLEIMQKLEVAARLNPDRLAVQPLPNSNTYQ